MVMSTVVDPISHATGSKAAASLKSAVLHWSLPWLPFPDNWQPNDKCQRRGDSTELINQIIGTKNKSQQNTGLLQIQPLSRIDGHSVCQRNPLG